jgi:hypothetical protein
LRAGEGAAVRVQLQSGSEPFRAQLIGATTAYLFLYEASSGQVTVVPVENLASLVPAPVG